MLNDALFPSPASCRGVHSAPVLCVPSATSKKLLAVGTVLRPQAVESMREDVLHNISKAYTAYRTG